MKITYDIVPGMYCYRSNGQTMMSNDRMHLIKTVLTAAYLEADKIKWHDEEKARWEGKEIEDDEEDETEYE